MSIRLATTRVSVSAEFSGRRPAKSMQPSPHSRRAELLLILESLAEMLLIDGESQQLIEVMGNALQAYANFGVACFCRCTV